MDELLVRLGTGSLVKRVTTLPQRSGTRSHKENDDRCYQEHYPDKDIRGFSIGLKRALMQHNEDIVRACFTRQEDLPWHPIGSRASQIFFATISTMTMTSRRPSPPLG